MVILIGSKVKCDSLLTELFQKKLNVIFASRQMHESTFHAYFTQNIKQAHYEEQSTPFIHLYQAIANCSICKFIITRINNMLLVHFNGYK